MNVFAGILGSLVAALIINLIGGIIVAAAGRTALRFVAVYGVVLLLTLTGTAWLRLQAGLPALIGDPELALTYAAGLLLDAFAFRSLFKLAGRWRATSHS